MHSSMRVYLSPPLASSTTAIHAKGRERHEETCCWKPSNAMSVLQKLHSIDHKALLSHTLGGRRPESLRFSFPLNFAVSSCGSNLVKGLAQMQGL